MHEYCFPERTTCTFWVQLLHIWDDPFEHLGIYLAASQPLNRLHMYLCGCFNTSTGYFLTFIFWQLGKDGKIAKRKICTYGGRGKMLKAVKDKSWTFIACISGMYISCSHTSPSETPVHGVSIDLNFCLCEFCCLTMRCIYAVMIHLTKENLLVHLLHTNNSE